MKQFKLANRALGWGVFFIAAITYILTIEPTTSFWDCGEFITTAYKLEVGHPPGAPFFMILGRVFTLLASDVTQVAVMINILSALVSAFTILFLFWSITHIAKKIVCKDEVPNTAQTISILGSSLVGALAYTFSDTFWFSAVEGEVYATSSLFTAVVFWAMLKWENTANEKYANRWIILIAYLIGLSIGVHLLNLLAIPAMVFIYYFKKYEVSVKGVISALLLSMLILGTTMYGIIPGIVYFASKFELLFVNGLGMPFTSGVLFYVALMIGLIIWGIYYTYTKRKVVANTILLSITVIIIGYSSFAMIVIRSIANPPMDQNSPDNVFGLKSYLNREQYGNRPLFKGNYFNAPVKFDGSGRPVREEGSPTYVKKDGKYVIATYSYEYEFEEDFQTIFPRMYSMQSNPQHIPQYLRWTGMSEGEVFYPHYDQNNQPVRNDQGEIVYNRNSPKAPPTFGHNLKFFFRYQIGFMYLRYFMWNFAGRQNDIQGHGSILNGNWLSGVPFVDNARLGDQSLLPERFKANKAHNKYYFLPLLLGLLGLVFHYIRNKNDFWVVMLLFVLTGLAIVVYLNQTPAQPRERDYAFAGSFYAFAIWIGLGVLALAEGLKKLSSPTIAGIAATVISLSAPIVMASENWDDHDRSGRYTARDFAYNYLASCDENAIIFTNGDNDTFPLWYVQEVEGYRTDVRVCNLSYLSTDWYIDQMKRRAYKSPPVPIRMTKEQYAPGVRDYTEIIEKSKDYGELSSVMKFVASDDLNKKNQENENYIPRKNLKITIDSAEMIKKGVVHPDDAALIVSEMKWTLNKRGIYKNDLMVLDMIANNNWERPIYYAITVGHDNYQNLQDYFQLEGLTYKIVPIKTPYAGGQVGRVNTRKMYDLMMNKFRWGGTDNPDVYLDENNSRMLMNVRNNFVRLAEALIEEGKKDKAVEVLDRCIEKIPHDRIPFNYYNLFMAQSYYETGQTEKANDIIRILSNSSIEDLTFFETLSPEQFAQLDDVDKSVIRLLSSCMGLLREYKQDALLEEINNLLGQ